jgi:hypothetical protein
VYIYLSTRLPQVALGLDFPFATTESEL